LFFFYEFALLIEEDIPLNDPNGQELKNTIKVLKEKIVRHPQFKK